MRFVFTTCCLLIILCTISKAQDTVSVSAGWNMFGSLSKIPVNLLRTEPEGIIMSSFYLFKNGTGYMIDDTLDKGGGYWVKSSQNGILIWGEIEITTAPITNITNDSAVGGGEVKSTGKSTVTERGVCWSKLENPLITENKTVNGAGIGSFVSSITGLAPLTKYYVRAYATNNEGTKYGEQVSFTSGIGSPCLSGATVDYGNKTYHTVQIGYQCWLKENLDIGVKISYPTLQTDNSIIEKYCYFGDTTYCQTYGGLYQWDELMQYDSTVSGQGICPQGWHVPSMNEFNVLNDLVGQNSNYLKAIGEGIGAGAGTNITGFSGLLAGWIDYNGTSASFSEVGAWWTSNHTTFDHASYLYIANDRSNVYAIETFRNYGFSVRCLKN